MEATPESNKPYVNPVLEGLTILIMVASGITILVTLVLSWSSEKHMESSANTTIGFVAIAVLFGAYKYKRFLTKKRDEWEYKQTLETKEEKELRIDDLFMYSRIYISDNTCTYLYYYIISNGVLYQVHPFEDGKFSTDYLGVGSLIHAKIIEEDNQLKIIEYSTLNRIAPSQYPNSAYEPTGMITEKYYGDTPYGLKDQTTADFPRIIIDARLKQNNAKNIQLKLDESGLRNIKEGHRDKYIVRINRHFEKVSIEDFLNFKTGDVATFTRNEKTGVSSIQVV